MSLITIATFVLLCTLTTTNPIIFIFGYLIPPTTTVTVDPIVHQKTSHNCFSVDVVPAGKHHVYYPQLYKIESSNCCSLSYEVKVLDNEAYDYHVNVYLLTMNQYHDMLDGSPFGYTHATLDTPLASINDFYVADDLSKIVVHNPTKEDLIIKWTLHANATPCGWFD